MNLQTVTTSLGTLSSTFIAPVSAMFLLSCAVTPFIVCAGIWRNQYRAQGRNELCQANFGESCRSLLFVLCLNRLLMDRGIDGNYLSFVFEVIWAYLWWQWQKKTQVMGDVTETNYTMKWVRSPGHVENEWWWHDWAAFWWLSQKFAFSFPIQFWKITDIHRNWYVRIKCNTTSKSFVSQN